MATLKLTLDEATLLFKRLPGAVQRHLRRGGAKAAGVIRERAHDKIGFTQPAIGPFNEWAPLAESTLEDKRAWGLGDGDGWPLLRTGEMRDSIGVREIGDLKWSIGSDDQKLVWQDQGTPTIPPRPVVGPAAIERGPEVRKILLDALLKALEGAR